MAGGSLLLLVSLGTFIAPCHFVATGTTAVVAAIVCAGVGLFVIGALISL